MASKAASAASRPRAENRIELQKVQTRLATIWLAGCGLNGLLLLGISFSYENSAQAKAIWEWALPYLSPRLTLILSVLAMQAMQPAKAVELVNRSFYRLTCALSIVYLALLPLPVLLRPELQYDLGEKLRLSTMWLGPFEALLSIAFGALFVADKARK